MSITRLKKVTLCGLLKEKRDVLEGLQDLGCLHLVPLRPPPAEVERALPAHAEGAYKALRFLTDVADRRRQVVRDPDFDVDRFVEEVLDLKQRLREATDRRDFLANRIREVEPWGDIDFPPEETLAGYRLWFYTLRRTDLRRLEGIGLPWHTTRQDDRVAYVVVIAKEEPPRDLLPVRRTHVGALPLSELAAQLEDVEIALEDLGAQRQALTRFIYLLSANLAEAENHASLANAGQKTRDDDAITAVQGWAPIETIEHLQEYAREHELACLIADPLPEDEPPTLIDQPEEMAAGVDLTLFYKVPSYTGWDPTVVLVGSFCVFFAMILADAGYGLLLALGVLLFWRRLGASLRGRGYRRLGVWLAVSSIAYGAIVGSYFGVTPPSDTWLARIHLLSVNDFDTMMRISIVIGVLHIGLANATVAYLNRARWTALSNIGWIVGLAGGLLYWLAASHDAARTAASVLMAIGGAMVLLFSSPRAVTTASDHAWRLLDGVRSLAGVMGAFGDVLSYMRLFALGLASASLAMTFNELARSAYAALPGLRVLAAVLILVIGHALNLGLSVLSGVVHGLRLNFIEFYKWGLPDEGTAFERFARKEVEP